MNAWYDNVPQIALGNTASKGIKTIFDFEKEKRLGQDAFSISFDGYLRSSKLSLFSNYITPIYNIGNVIVSYCCPNPTKRARDRGYTLN